jgi:hypothetical protein
LTINSIEEVWSAKNHLKPEQRQKLQKALKQAENGDIRERILILLLLNDGKTRLRNC